MLKVEIKDVENETIYYKVVSRGGKKLYSAFVHTQILSSQYFKLRKLQVEYMVGKWAKPKVQGTKLCVFNNLKAAITYSHDIINPLIYTCHIRGKGILPSNIKTVSVDEYLMDKVKAIWERWESVSLTPYRNATSAEEVKLIELVKIK